MSCPTTDTHNSRREGVRLGLIVATATWLWVAALALGNGAWLGIFVGSLIGASIAFVPLTRTHPVAAYLHRAEAET